MYTVLLADDSESVRTLASNVLRRAGYGVLAVEDGAQALALARVYPGSIDLLVTDVMMSQMNGIALRRAFAEFHPATPVLFISGEPRNTIVGEHFLPKPFTPAQLTSTVAALLASAYPALHDSPEIATGHNHL
ncbi:MAG TPA: response regulator [Terriglobia bacterium]|jgi:CheY-like chemotaxis protein|nr:response regulator [Terriglobia bacterium]